MACGACTKCGKKLKSQGGQCICMNDACPNYLIGVEPTKVSNLGEARTSAKSMVQDPENPNY